MPIFSHFPPVFSYLTVSYQPRLKHLWHLWGKVKGLYFKEVTFQEIAKKNMKLIFCFVNEIIFHHKKIENVLRNIELTCVNSVGLPVHLQEARDQLDGAAHNILCVTTFDQKKNEENRLKFTNRIKFLRTSFILLTVFDLHFLNSWHKSKMAHLFRDVWVDKICFWIDKVNIYATVRFTKHFKFEIFFQTGWFVVSKPENEQ